MKEHIGSRVKYSHRFLAKTTIAAASTYRGTIIAVMASGKAKVQWDGTGTTTTKFWNLTAA